MNARKLGLTQLESSAMAEISERTGQRIDSGHHRTNRGTVVELPRSQDPLAAVWTSELEPMLRREPRLKPMTLFEYLKEQYPGKYDKVLRTLQRRVREWKALHGPEPEVMFMLRHELGVIGLSDFTKLKGMEITINGVVFEHLIYHYRLSYSGCLGRHSLAPQSDAGSYRWQYAQIVQGGESFVALSEGLQNALAASGGAPKEHRTDSLSAAYRNSGGHRTKEYQGHSHKITDWTAFRAFVTANADKTQKEMAELWPEQISDRTISRALKQIGFTRKSGETPRRFAALGNVHQDKDLWIQAAR